MQSHKMPCLECQAKLMPSKRGMPKRFCSAACKQTFNNRRAMRGALLYDLYYANRVDRSKATELKVRRAMDRLVIRWRDEDAGRKTYKPIMMALADIEALDRPPSTNLYEGD